MSPSFFLSELGNEPDFYPTFPNYCRPPNYTMAEYVREWNWKSDVLARAMEESCPGVNVGFVAPTFIWTNFSGRTPWNVGRAFDLGLQKESIREIALHK